MSIHKMRSNPVKTNAVQGKYRPYFFDYAHFNISEAEFSSHYYSEEDVEEILLERSFSFAYLRDNKLRTIRVTDRAHNPIDFNQFLARFNIQINSNNLFKTGKYLSRVFRPVRYGSHFKELDIHINKEESLTTKITDGISLISLELARSLGWQKAEPNMSAQFTLFYNGGLVKGHCVVSDRTEHDIVIYGEDNVKTEISYDSDAQYVALEPVKLSNKLRMDIQSLVNLWGLFRGEQYLSWADSGIRQFIDDLFSGKLLRWLDNFDSITPDDYDKEQWILRKAIWSRIDYTLFPGLIRSAWTMFRSSLVRYSSDINGNPNFRIPIPSGIRGYLRVDLREHDSKGSFCSNLKADEVEIDKFGNVWFSPEGLEETLSILGGADLDDGLNFIGIEDNKAVIYRNPNQFGEYVIKKVVHTDVEFGSVHKIIGEVPQKKVIREKSSKENVASTGNSLLDKFLSEKKDTYIPAREYTITNLIRTYNKISQNTCNVGFAANAEMILSSINISHPAKFKKLKKQFTWNLERIIDATVKDGTDASEDMQVIQALYEYLIEHNIPVPQSLLNRMPESKRNLATIAKRHTLDELLSAIEHLVKAADLEVLGKGAASSGRRIPGRIDELDIPLDVIGISAIESPMYDLGLSMLKDYNRSMAIMLDKTGKLVPELREIRRKEGIEKIQAALLKNLSSYTDEERTEIVKVFAYEVYKKYAVHDSILWIGDKETLEGTACYTIKMLANLGLAEHIKSNGDVKRFKEIRNVSPGIRAIRLWSKERLSAESFSDQKEIYVESGEAILGNRKLTLGDECRVTDGKYGIINIVNSKSRKTSAKLHNSLTLYLK